MNYDHLVWVSPTASQPEIQVVLKGFKAGLSKKQILKLFELQSQVFDLDAALAKLSEDSSKTQKSKHKSKQIKVTELKSVDELPPPEVLVGASRSDRSKKHGRDAARVSDMSQTVSRSQPEGRVATAVSDEREEF